jgi:hypothetical protein
MKQSQGSVPVEDSLIQMENSPPNYIVKSPVSLDQSELVHLKDDSDRNNLAKSILFGCERCCGPLVPIADCQICQKASMRQCVECKFQVVSGKHDSCKKLIIFAKFSSKRFLNKKEIKK